MVRHLQPRRGIRVGPWSRSKLEEIKFRQRTKDKLTGGLLNISGHGGGTGGRESGTKENKNGESAINGIFIA